MRDSVFLVEIYGFFSCTASVAVNDTIMSLDFVFFTLSQVSCPRKQNYSVPGPYSNQICLIMGWVHCQTMRLPSFYIQYLVFETLNTNNLQIQIQNALWHECKKIIRWTAKSWLITAWYDCNSWKRSHFPAKFYLEVNLMVHKPAKAELSLQNVAPSSTEQDLSLVRLPFHHVPSLQSSRVGGSLVFHIVLFVWNSK